MQKNTSHVTAIILAAGLGSRMCLGYNKVLHVMDKPILSYSLEAFERSSCISDVVLVVAERDRSEIDSMLKQGEFSKVKRIVSGGETRQDSSRIGVSTAESADIVAVHDGARPFVSQKTIDACLKSAKRYGSGVVAVPAKDTMKRATADGIVEETIDRSTLWIVQTPQVFRYDILRKAHEKACRDGFVGTDEASLVERLGSEVRLVEGEYENIKVTTPEDLSLAQIILEKRCV